MLTFGICHFTLVPMQNDQINSWWIQSDEFYLCYSSTGAGLQLMFQFPQAGETVRMLLKVAKKTIPRLDWKRTPLVLRATAGLRLLPAAKAQALLDQVRLHISKILAKVGTSS